VQSANALNVKRTKKRSEGALAKSILPAAREREFVCFREKCSLVFSQVMRRTNEKEQSGEQSIEIVKERLRYDQCVCPRPLLGISAKLLRSFRTCRRIALCLIVSLTFTRKRATITVTNEAEDTPVYSLNDFIEIRLAKRIGKIDAGDYRSLFPLLLEHAQTLGAFPMHYFTDFLFRDASIEDANIRIILATFKRAWRGGKGSIKLSPDPETGLYKSSVLQCRVAPNLLASEYSAYIDFPGPERTGSRTEDGSMINPGFFITMARGRRGEAGRGGNTLDEI